MYIEFLIKFFRTFIFNRHTTPVKLLNLARAAMAQFACRESALFLRPVKLIVDPAGFCNLTCPLCPTGQRRTERSKGFMSLEMYQNLIDENSDFLFEVDLYNWGEPLLNNDIAAMISYARQRNIRVTVSSNLNILTDDMAEKIVASGLERLVISIDGATEKTYSRYRVGGQLKTVLENAKKILGFKAKLKSKYPELIWQFIVFKHNAHEIDAARSLASAGGFDTFHVRYMRSDMGRELFLGDSERIRESAAWLPRLSSMSRYDYRAATRKMKPSTCLFLWTQGVVNWNGSVSPCCAVYDESMDFGNAFTENSFLRVWNNAKFQNARRLVKNRTVDPGCVCSNCIEHGFIEY